MFFTFPDFETSVFALENGMQTSIDTTIQPKCALGLIEVSTVRVGPPVAFLEVPIDTTVQPKCALGLIEMSTVRAGPLVALLGSPLIQPFNQISLWVL